MNGRAQTSPRIWAHLAVVSWFIMLLQGAYAIHSYDDYSYFIAWAAATAFMIGLRLVAERAQAKEDDGNRGVA